MGLTHRKKAPNENGDPEKGDPAAEEKRHEEEERSRKFRFAVVSSSFIFVNT